MAVTLNSNTSQMSPIIDQLQTEGFTVCALENQNRTMQYRGRDGYRKVALISGIGEIKYQHHVYKVNGSALLVTKAGDSCTWSVSSTSRASYVCAFNDDFLNTSCLGSNQACDQYFLSNPIFNLNPEQEQFVRTIFCRMVDEQKSDYSFKTELIQNQLCVLTHMALRMTASRKLKYSSSDSMPTAAVFLELVELGFQPAGQALHFN